MLLAGRYLSEQERFEVIEGRRFRGELFCSASKDAPNKPVDDGPEQAQTLNP